MTSVTHRAADRRDIKLSFRMRLAIASCLLLVWADRAPTQKATIGSGAQSFSLKLRVPSDRVFGRGAQLVDARGLAASRRENDSLLSSERHMWV